MLLMNPRRRKRKAKTSHRRRARRAMTAKQLKYFGPRRRRSSSRSRAVIVHANPIRRSRRRHAAVARRRFRRNPIRMSAMAGQLRASLPSIMHAGANALAGGAGAVGADIAMGQLLALLPASTVTSIGSRYDATGKPNLAYYGVKLGMTTLLGIAGAHFLPGKMKGYATKAATGALTVGAYEIMRLMLPAGIALGYYSASPVQSGGPVNPTGARNTRLGAYTGRRLSGMGASFPAGSAMRHVPAKEMRIGEGDIE